MKRRMFQTLTLLAVFVLAVGCATTGVQQPAEGEGEGAAEEGVTGLYGEEAQPGATEGGLETDPGTVAEGDPPPDGGGDVDTGATSGDDPGAAVEPGADEGLVGGDVLLQEYRSARDLADWPLAEDKLVALTRLSPNDAKVAYDLAVVRIKLGKLEEAVESARRAFELDSKSVASARLALLAMRELEMRSEADSFAEHVASKDPQNVDLQAVRLEALLLKKEYLRVQELARALLKKDEINVGIMTSLGRAYFLMGKLKTAKYVFRRALELAPSDPDLLYYLALVEDRDGHMAPAKVLAMYGKVLAVKPDYPEALNNVGMIFYATRNYQQASEKFGEAVRYAPDFRGAKLNLANALRGLKQYAEADRLYIELVEANTGFAAAYFNRGLLYLESEFGGMARVERLHKAAEYLRKYKEVAGRSLRENDPADQYIQEAMELADQFSKAQEEEERLRVEAEAKYERLLPDAQAAIVAHEARRKKLTDGLTAWQSAENMDRVEQFEGLIAEYDEVVGALLEELASAVENKLGDDMEYALEGIPAALEELQPMVDEAFEEPPPVTDTPRDEVPLDEPPVDEPPIDEPPIDEPPIDDEPSVDDEPPVDVAD